MSLNFHGIPVRMIVVAGCITLGALSAGCSGGVRSTRQFPSTWPGSEPLSSSAPTLAVEPFEMRVEPVTGLPEGQEGLPTSAVLSALFVKHLHANGVNADLEIVDAETTQFSLRCSVPQLGFGSRDGLPQETQYEAELSCVLRDEQSDTQIWDRSYTQRYQESVMVDMITGLDEQPNVHERILFRECITPLWDTMAANVRTVLVGRQRITRHAE